MGNARVRKRRQGQDPGQERVYGSNGAKSPSPPPGRIPLADLLQQYGACQPAIEWSRPYGLGYERAWAECQVGHWMVWFLRVVCGADPFHFPSFERENVRLFRLRHSWDQIQALYVDLVRRHTAGRTFARAR